MLGFKSGDFVEEKVGGGATVVRLRRKFYFETKKLLSSHTCCCFAKEGLSNGDVGVARGTVPQGVWDGAGFKTSDFVKDKLAGLPQNDLGSTFWPNILG